MIGPVCFIKFEWWVPENKVISNSRPRLVGSCHALQNALDHVGAISIVCPPARASSLRYGECIMVVLGARGWHKLNVMDFG